MTPRVTPMVWDRPTLCRLGGSRSHFGPMVRVVFGWFSKSLRSDGTCCLWVVFEVPSTRWYALSLGGSRSPFGPMVRVVFGWFSKCLRPDGTCCLCLYLRMCFARFMNLSPTLASRVATVLSPLQAFQRISRLHDSVFSEQLACLLNAYLIFHSCLRPTLFCPVEVIIPRVHYFAPSSTGASLSAVPFLGIGLSETRPSTNGKCSHSSPCENFLAGLPESFDLCLTIHLARASALFQAGLLYMGIVFFCTSSTIVMARWILI